MNPNSANFHTAYSQDLLNFAAEVGAREDDDIVVAGGKTQWEIGGRPSSSAREIAAPAGIRSFEPEDMVVRCGTGTTLEELSEALGKARQMVPFDLPNPESATVGGALAVGHSGFRRLRYGPIRDCLLEVIFVDGEGQLIRSGGPTVKNVSGYDLCRLMVGSLGTLGCLGEVVLRCYPRPKSGQWFVAHDNPFSLLSSLWQPSSILWDGDKTSVLLEGHPVDISSQAEANGLEECEQPENLHSPDWQRISLNPAALPAFADHLRENSSANSPAAEAEAGNSPAEAAETFMAEVGVGIIRLGAGLQLSADFLSDWLPTNDARSLALQREIKARFDPSGRLNPGRNIWGNSQSATPQGLVADRVSAAPG